MKRIVFFYILLMACRAAFAQSLEPAVMNASGGNASVGSGTATVEVYYSIGEPLMTVQQSGSAMLTQGFLQPDLLGHIGLSYTPLVNSETCLDKSDGKILLSLNAQPVGTAYEQYYWTPSSVCPGNNCQGLDSLAPGNYTVIAVAYNSSGQPLDSAAYSYNIAKSSEPCQITVYSGFTPNGDGKNEVMYIENIENFPDNTVYIYSRWGTKIFEMHNYNNVDHAWDGHSKNGGAVTAGTYFYVIELSKGAAVKKGWVEVTTN